MAGLRFPPHERLERRRYRRRTSAGGRSDWLGLLRRTLSFPISSRFIPAHPDPFSGSYTFSFDYDLASWDSYTPDESGITGYWDSFVISVTSLPYDTLALNEDPLQFPFVWGGAQFADGVLATTSEEGEVLTFAGDGEHPMFLNVILDTSNPPLADTFYPSWGTFTLPLIGNLTAHRPMHDTNSYSPFQKTAVAEGDEESPDLGPGIRINRDDDDGQGRGVPDNQQSQVDNENDLIEVTIDSVGIPSAPQGLVLQTTTTDLLVWAAADKGNEHLVFPGGPDGGLQSDPIQFDENGELTVFVEWFGANHGLADLKLADPNSGFVYDTLTFHTFKSVVIGLSGEQFSEDSGSGDYLDSGMFDVATDLYELGYDAHYFNEDEVGNHPILGATFAEVENALEERNVNSLAIYGHSHGGGSKHDLAESISAYYEGIGPMFDLSLTAYVDAIKQEDAVSETRLPPESDYHVNYDQHVGPLAPPLFMEVLGGNTMSDADIDLNVNVDLNWNDPSGNDLEHTTIDDSPDLQTHLKVQFLNKVPR